MVLLRSAGRKRMSKIDGWVRPSYAGCSVPKAKVTSPTCCRCAPAHSAIGPSSGTGYQRSTGTSCVAPVYLPSHSSRSTSPERSRTGPMCILPTVVEGVAPCAPCRAVERGARRHLEGRRSPRREPATNEEYSPYFAVSCAAMKRRGCAPVGRPKRWRSTLPLHTHKPQYNKHPKHTCTSSPQSR